MSIFDVGNCDAEWLWGRPLSYKGFENPHIDRVSNGVAYIKLDRRGKSPCIIDFCKLKEIEDQIISMKSKDSLWISPLEDSFEHRLSFHIESTKRITYGNARWKIKHDGAIGLNFKAPIIGVYGTNKIKDCNFDCDYIVFQPNTNIINNPLKFENFKCSASTLIIESPNAFIHGLIHSSLDTYTGSLLKTIESIRELNLIIFYAKDTPTGQRKLYDKYIIIHKADIKIEDLKEHKYFNNEWMTGYTDNYNLMKKDRDLFIL